MKKTIALLCLLIENICTHFDFIILTVATVFVIPFFGLSSTIDPVLTPRFLVWGIVVFILSISILEQLRGSCDKTDYSALRRLIFPVFLGYFLFSVISLCKAVNISEGIYEVLKVFLSMVFLFVATMILGKNKDYIHYLVKAVIVTATVLSAIGAYQYFHYEVAFCVGTMANKNQLASALFLMLPFCIYAIMAFRGFWRIISIVPTSLILLDIFLIRARAVWAGLFISTGVMVIASVLLFRKISDLKESKKQYVKAFITIAVILLISISAASIFFFQSPYTDYVIKHIKSVESIKERVLVWGKTIEMCKDNLMLGIGAGNWRIMVPSYGLGGLPERAFKDIHFQRPHNDYMWVLSETGVFGLVFYLSIFVIAIVYIFKLITQQSTTDDKLFAIFMFFGIVGYMVIAFFSFPKERIFHSMFLLLMLAIIISMYHRTIGHTKNISRPFIFIVMLSCVLLLPFALIDGFLRLKAEVFTNKALEARKAGDLPLVVSCIDKGYSAYATLDPMSAPLQWYRGEANFLMNNISEAQEDFEKAYAAHPHHIHVLNNLATCYELKDDYPRAISYYNDALDIFPEFEDVLINLGAAYYNSGRYSEALQTLLRCNPIKQNVRLQQYIKVVKEKIDEEKVLL